MQMFIYKIPKLVKRLFPNLIWEVPRSQHQDKFIYFTFDDGPTPEITNFVLDELHKFNAKATFFCIGKNIQANPALFHRIFHEGHSIGNHTMNHLNAWKENTKAYHTDILHCESEIVKNNTFSIGFRPPYGRLKKLKLLLKQVEKIYMWSVLTGDYRSEKCAKQIINNCLPHLKAGAIVVFHDSLKASHNLKIILPIFLAYCKKQNLILSGL